jgi:hypothetical protein
MQVDRPALHAHIVEGAGRGLRPDRLLPRL